MRKSLRKSMEKEEQRRHVNDLKDVPKSLSPVLDALEHDNFVSEIDYLPNTGTLMDAPHVSTRLSIFRDTCQAIPKPAETG